MCCAHLMVFDKVYNTVVGELVGPKEVIALLGGVDKEVFTPVTGPVRDRVAPDFFADTHEERALGLIQ